MAVSLLFALGRGSSDDPAKDRQCRDGAHSGECSRNAAYMQKECSKECRCHAWAAAGECVSNGAYMRSRCAEACELHERPAAPPSPPAISEADCSAWASQGECYNNKVFMEGQCGGSCAHAARRERCSEHACAGLPEPVPCRGAVHRPSPRNGSWPLAAGVMEAVYGAGVAPVAFVNERATAGWLHWVDDAGKEVGYGVLMPGGRLTTQTFIGHHWRVRELESGALWHEAHVQVVRAKPCVCAAYRPPRDAALHAAQTVGGVRVHARSNAPDPVGRRFSSPRVRVSHRVPRG
jgi:hypothetical protein